jgi:5'-nucleotidase
MRILVSNDDGIDAPGLALLANAAREATDDVWVVAPARKWTASSHQLSFDRDLELRRVGARTFACSGAPADCVVAAMTVLLADRRPDLVLAGINDKRNVGEDSAYSGTMAIAREATFWGTPAVAWSSDGSNVTAALLHRLIEALWQTRNEWSAHGRWLAVNLPATLPAAVEVAGVAHDKIASACDVLERSPERIVFRLRRGRPGSDAPGDENAILAAGAISVVSHGWQSDSAVPPGVLAALRNAAE